MKILMITDFFPPFLGGLERIVADLSAGLSVEGHSVQIATLWHPGLARTEETGGVRVNRFQGSLQQLSFLFAQEDRRYQPPVPDPAILFQLDHLIADFRPDVVHGHSWLMLSALPLKRRYGFATVATLHDYSLLCPKKTLLYNEVEPCVYQVGRHCLSCAPQAYGVPKGLLTSGGLSLTRPLYQGIDAFIAISTYVADVHARWKVIAESTLVTIPNFVRDDVLYALPGAALPELPPDYILYVGQLGRHKGLYTLLDAYTSLHVETPLVIIGPTVSDTPREFPRNVYVQFGRSHADVLRAIDHSRFVVTPGLWPEPFGLVVLEAMARGKAVVASASGGTLDIVQHQENGLLIPPGETTKLSEAMRALLEAPDLARQMGKRGAERCRLHFSSDVVVHRTYDLYRSVVGAKIGSAC